MSYTRCFSTLGCPDADLAQVFALAGRHGVGAVELRALGGTLDLPAYFQREFGSPQKLADALGASPVRVAAFDASLHLVGATTAEREQLVALAPWADACGVRWLRVFDGGAQADEGELAEAHRTIDWWRELKCRNGWRAELAVETHDSLFTAAAIGRFLARRPETAILWDSHHTWKRGSEDPLETWRAIKAHVVQVHVKDSVGDRTSERGFRYVAPGTGEFPMGTLRETLAAEFDGPVSLEWEKWWHPYLGTLDEALEGARVRAWW